MRPRYLTTQVPGPHTEYMTTRTEIRTGYGPTRKTRKSAQREVDLWTASGSGTTYRYQAMHGKPAYTETIVTEVQVVEGGFVCAYVTTREIEEN